MSDQAPQTFSKQGYVHLHSLFSEIADYIEDNNPEIYNQLDFTDYENMNLKPTSVHKTKTDHKKAVQELSTTLAEACESLEP